jgi:hypothetical protein
MSLSRLGLVSRRAKELILGLPGDVPQGRRVHPNKISHQDRRWRHLDRLDRCQFVAPSRVLPIRCVFEGQRILRSLGRRLMRLSQSTERPRVFE